MSRGLALVLSGFLPILLGIATEKMIGRDFPVGVGALLMLLTGILFVLGTAWIAIDKGHSWVVGIVLGLVAPLGTAIAVLLPDNNATTDHGRQAKTRNSPRVSELEDSPTERDQKPGERSPGTFDTFMEWQGRLLWPVTLLYGTVVGVSMAMHFLSFKGGIPVAKAFIGLSGGLFYGAAFAGVLTFWPLVFAPGDWLRSSKTGRAWMDRTGLKNTKSVVPLKMMSFLIAIACTAMTVVLFMGAIESTAK